MKTTHLVILLYDSVTNSVFESQVLAPFARMIAAGTYKTMTIITYEKQGFIHSPAYIQLQEQLRAYHQSITCSILERPIFLGLFSLRLLVKKLACVIAQEPEHTLIARGPLAGYLAQRIKTTQTKEIIIQARGLLYEEYCITTKHARWWLKPVHAYRAYQYKNVEQMVYGTKKTFIPTTLEAVSPALAISLNSSYQPTMPITQAIHDTPAVAPENDRQQWRTQYRTRLGITDNALVYAYNGSIKPWQCPEIVFSFFKEQLGKNSSCRLLFISQDTANAKQYATAYNLPADAVIYQTVSHAEVIPLLCAADYGLLFRKQHIVNWTSRPTKLLEYQSAGLPVIHNKTIELLHQNSEHFYDVQ